MSDTRTTRPSIPEPNLPAQQDRTEWERLRAMTDEQAAAGAAQDPDSPPTDPAFWHSARVALPPGKAKISLYLDRDVLAWFKQDGKGYQTRVNAVLRSYMNAQLTTVSAS